MPKPIKWILAALAVVVVLVIAIMVAVGLFFDVNKYRPQIEEQAEKATGREFTLGGELDLSVFPWVGVSMSDVHLGNPPEFKEKDMVGVDFFEVRVKLLPLLLGNVEVKRFVLNGAKITLIKNPDGRLNVEGIPPAKDVEEKGPAEPAPGPAPGGEGGLPIKDLEVDEFAIRNGSLVWIDMTSDTRKEVKQINLILEDLSLDKPIGLDFNALADNRPVSLTGTLGPVGPEPGKSPVAFDLVLEMAGIIQSKMNGRVDPGGQVPGFNLTMDVAPFSARRLLAELSQSLPFEPADPAVLQKIALTFSLDGSSEAVAVNDGRLTLDDSQVRFSAQAKDFAKPDLTLTATLDNIDLDRYLPPPSETEPSGEADKSRPPADKATPIDYTPLRQLVLDGRINVDKLKAKNVRMQNIALHATAKNGILRANPVSMDLYSGKIKMDGTANVQGKAPESAVNLNISDLQAGPLIKDFLDKELIEGVLNAALKLQFSGDQPDRIRKTIDGGGELKFNDGAIVGIDLADMIRNVKAAFGGQGRPEKKPRTDFSELVVPLTIKNGLANIDGTKLNSPLIRITAGGNAHVAEETLDLRIEPKFVATLVGQGDTAEQRSGVKVPVLVTGTFSDPKFTPDLKGMISTQVPGKEKVTEELEETKKKVTEDIQKKTQDLFKGLPFGGGKE